MASLAGIGNLDPTHLPQMGPSSDKCGGKFKILRRHLFAGAISSSLEVLWRSRAKQFLSCPTSVELLPLKVAEEKPRPHTRPNYMVSLLNLSFYQMPSLTGTFLKASQMLAPQPFTSSMTSSALRTFESSHRILAQLEWSPGCICCRHPRFKCIEMINGMPSCSPCSSAVRLVVSTRTQVPCRRGCFHSAEIFH